MVPVLNQKVFLVQTQTTGGLPRPVADTIYGTFTQTQHRERHRWPIEWSGFDTSRESQIHVWKTWWPSRKECKRCMGTRTDTSMWESSVWPSSSKKQMNWWESMSIKSRQIGEQLDGSQRITKTFTKSLGADYDQDLSPRLSRWLQRMQDLTVWKSFSTAPPIQKSYQIAKSPNSSNHINTKSSEENDLNRWAKNVTSEHQYQSLLKHRSPTSESRTRMINALLHHGSRQSSMVNWSRNENAYAVGHTNRIHSGARNILAPTSPKTMLIGETENNSNASALLIANNKTTNLSLSETS